MREYLPYFGITTISKMGRCRFCMRAAFVSAVSTSILAFGILAVWPGAVMGYGLAGVAAALLVLWLAHITAYAARTARCKVKTVTVLDNSLATHTRRDLLPLFAKAFAFMVLATALPALSRPAFADGCPAETPYECGTNWCCAAAAIWYCGGYSGNVAQWQNLGSFCTNSNSDEDVADLRSNCNVLEHC